MLRSLNLWIYYTLVTVRGHSWIDNLAETTNLTNVGFIRDYEGHIDATSSFLIQSNTSTQPLCKSNQLKQTYTMQYPMLSVTAGTQFVANYTENGHVTKDALQPDGKPHPGNYTWYLMSNSPSSPNPMTTLGDTASARVIATGNFDDGQCAEDATRGRSGPRNCQSFVTVPDDVGPGTYQLVWLWNFPKVAGVVEMYSSCADLNVTSSKEERGEEEAVNLSTTGTRTSTLTQTITLETTVPAKVSTTRNLGIYTTFISVPVTLPPPQINPLVDANNAPTGLWPVSYILKTVAQTVTSTSTNIE